MHLGGSRGPFKFDHESSRRNLVRAIVLAQLATGKLQSSQVDTRLTSLLALKVGRLERELLGQFPYKPFRGQFAKRADWMPTLFTNPWHHDEGSYRYLVHTIAGAASKVIDVMKVGAESSDLEAFDTLRQKYLMYAKLDVHNPLISSLMVNFCEKYLDNPQIIQQNIISSTLITEKKHSTYYPFGFIMRVPPQCIYITSPRDVGVANRTTNILGELQVKQLKAKSQIWSPAEIEAQTNKSEGDTGYNEIVVVGTSPEGRQVEVIGLFVKTNGKGKIFMRNGATEDVDKPFFNEELLKKISACAAKYKLPVVPIPDVSSGASKIAWPIGTLRGTNDRQLPGRARSDTV